MAQRKCVVCGEIFSKEELERAVPFKGRLAHEKCFNLSMKILVNDKKEQIEKKKKNTSAEKKVVNVAKSKQTQMLTDPVSEEEYHDKKALYDYLQQILQTETLNPKIYALTQKYIKEYGTSYREIKDAFYYWFELKNHEPQGDCIGLIPYILEESRVYWRIVEDIEKRNKDKDIKSFYNRKIITINPKKRKIKQLDIDSIGADKEL